MIDSLDERECYCGFARAWYAARSKRVSVRWLDVRSAGGPRNGDQDAMSRSAAAAVTESARLSNSTKTTALTSCIDLRPSERAHRRYAPSHECLRKYGCRGPSNASTSVVKPSHVHHFNVTAVSSPQSSRYMPEYVVVCLNVVHRYTQT